MTRRARILGCILALLLTGMASGWSGPASAAAKPSVSLPNDPFFARQWYLGRIGAPTAWKTTQGKGAVVAVVDTGVDVRHPDLKPQMLPGTDTINHDSDPADPEGHGTSVSGIIAAVSNNRVGIAGIAPKAKIMPVRACSRVGENTCDMQAVTDGIMWATDHGANVINLSLGGAVPQAEEVAVIYAAAHDVLVIASAGNSSTPACGFPAAGPLALCVGASDNLDGLADFSSYGVRLDVVAPGVGLWTTARGFQYTSFNGTSAAAPVVSGIGALLMSMGATSFQAAQIIRATAKDLGLPGYDPTYGFGRVDAKAAVALCAQIC